MSNIIIKNNVKLLGKTDDVKEIIESLKSEKSLIDFNNIEPMKKDSDDIDFNNYTNFVLNVYLHEHPFDVEELAKAFRFTGRTREIPYEFELLKEKQLNDFKKKYKMETVRRDANAIVEKIKSKAIFNGYLVRDVFWGTGSDANKPKVTNNQLDFETFDKAPIKLFAKLSSMHSNIKIEFTYMIELKITKIMIENGNVKYLSDDNHDYQDKRLFDLITDNVRI